MISLLLASLISSAYALNGAYGLTTVSGVVTDPREPVLTIANMPAVRSQSRVGLCASFAAAALIDYRMCVKNKVVDCASEPDEHKVSVLDLSRFSVVDLGDSRFAYDALKEGGYTPLILQNVSETRHVAVEACAPFSRFVQDIDPNGTESLWNRFQDVYMEKGERDQSYGQFLASFLVPKECTNRRAFLRGAGEFEMDVFPKSDSFANLKTVKEKRQLIVGKIKELLGQQIPVAIDFCGDVPFDAKKIQEFSRCKNGHAAVIKGYKRVCAQANAKKCRTMLQIHNSWGQKWQDENDNGWVDGDSLLDRTLFDTNQLSWIVPDQES